MSIYLAWSIYKLGLGLLLVLGLAMLVATFNTTQPRIKKALITLAVGVVLVFAMALSIGDRQQSLQRSSFNATLEEAPAYVPPPPDILKETRSNFEKSILEIQPKKESN